MNTPIPAPPRPRMFMQPIVGSKWASYSGRLEFVTVPHELQPAPGRKGRKIANPSLLELRTFHLKSS